MKKQDKNKENKNKCRIQDIIVAAICVLAIVVITVSVVISNRRTRQKKEQLDYVQEQMQQENTQKEAENSPYSGIIVNEINQSGWVEFYNSSNAEQNLKGIKILLDGKEVLDIEEDTVLGAGEIEAYEFLENLGLTSHVLTLVNADYEKLSSIMVPALDEMQSYGYAAEGSQETAILQPTKGTSNVEMKIGNVTEIMFSIPAGFYEETISLAIAAPKGCEIYYTTDGTEPTQESQKYEEPIRITNRSGSAYTYAASDGIGYEYMCEPKSISMGTVIRAIAVDENGKIADERTASYYIGIGQNSELADMPVISITANPDGLFDYFEGMYVSGRSYEDALAAEKEQPAGNYLKGWTREVHIEYFETNKDRTYEGNVTLSMLEDNNVTLAQKGMQIVNDGEEVNEGSTLSEFLKGVDTKTMLQAYKSDYKYRVRELIAKELLANAGIITYQAVPCNVFINGEYWGGYLLKTPYDSEYIAACNELENSESVIIAENGEVKNRKYQSLYDDMYYFVTQNDMSAAENYRMAENLMDMQSYVEYVCVNMYLANVDYGRQEVLWKSVSENAGETGAWHWLCTDLDNTMGNTYSGKRSTASIDTYLQKNMANDSFFASLIKNKEFQSLLQETMKRMAEETFGEDAVEKAVNDVASKMQKVSISSLKRFYGEPSNNFFTNGITDVKEFFEERAKYIVLYTDEVVENRGIVLTE